MTASDEKVISIHFSANGRYLGISWNSLREITVYLFWSGTNALRKRTQRSRMRREKEWNNKGKASLSSSTTNGDLTKNKKKRSILNNDNDNNKEEEPTLIPLLSESQDPEEFNAAVEFHYLSTIKCSHRVKGFIFSIFWDGKRNARVKMVAALSSNAI